VDRRKGAVRQVEDEPVTARLVERAVSRRPAVRLVTAATAEDGVRLARAERPDLVLVDLQLPDASGYDVVQRLRSDPATRELPLVAVTASAGVERDGFEDVLTKPVDVGRLLELVAERAPADVRGAAAADRLRDRDIVEAVPHGIVLLDTEGLVLDVNPATERILGYGRAELLGQPCGPFTHPDDHRAEEPLLVAVLRGER